jgi:hypothetical protein
MERLAGFVLVVVVSCAWAASGRARSVEESRMSRNRSGWTVGTDRMAPRDWSGEVVEMPSGRLHAVSDPGLIVGRALCLAPVILLDPRDWRWPDDGDEEWPLCRICLALTHVGF